MAGLPGLAQGQEPLRGVVRDVRGRPVQCEAALLVEREVVVACSEDGSFALLVTQALAEAGETLVVFAPGFRDSVTRIDADAQDLAVTLRRGRSRRSQTTTRSGDQARALPRRTPQADRSFDVGSAVVTPARHAEAAGGYQDLNRTLHGLPGVSGDTAASARLRVRGGEAHETLTFVDGIRVLDPTHLGGLFGALDPDLAAEVRVDSVAPSAAVPDSLGGAIQASYLDGPHDRFDGAVDLSFLGAGAHVAVDLGRTPGNGARLVVGARRSLLQAYLSAFDALGVTDIPLDTVDFGSAYLRFGVPTGDRSRLRLTVLHLHDRALFDDVNLRHRLLGGAARWDRAAGPQTDVYAHLGWVWEEDAEPETDNVYPGKRTWSSGVHHGRILAGVVQRFGPGHSLQLGLDGGPVLRRARGELLDPAQLPAWAALPQADLAQGAVRADELQEDHGDLDLFAEASLVQLGVARLRLGARVSLLNASLTPRVSPRAAVVVPFPTGTVLRGSVALTHQDRPDRAVLGAVLARPERGLTASLAVAQELAGVAVVEVTAWGRALDHLLVPTGEPSAWASDGTGLAAGLDVTGFVRVGRFEANVGWSFLGTRRTNPREQRYAETIAPPGDQRHDLEVGARLFLGRTRNLLLGLGYSGASGPPASTLSPAPRGDGSFLWDITGLNDRRLEPRHRVDLRVEHRIPTRFLRLRASLEVNVDLGSKVFLENCASDPPAGEAPSCHPLTFWPPVRPWLGLKAEW
jgi:hypothetical protein